MYTSPESADNGLVAVKSGEKWGFIDKTGKFAVNPQFDYAYGFADNGLAAVQSGDKWGYIDNTGKFVINPQFDDAETFSENVARVKLGDLYGLIDKTGSYVVNPSYPMLGEAVSGGLICFANDDKKVGYLDATGKEVIPAQFD